MDSLTLQAGPAAFGDASHPTTVLLLNALDAVAPAFSPATICDMGAGSGILALRAAQLWPEARIIAAELERAAVETIRTNAQTNNVPLLETLTPSSTKNHGLSHDFSSRSLSLCEGEGGIIAVHSDGFCHPEIKARAPYELILMNILAEPILTLLHDAHAMLAEEGVLMLSGMMEHQQQTIHDASVGLGLELSYRLSQDGWVAHLWQKP